MKYKSFAVFILSHGRPDNVKTVNALLSSGYSGEWYIVIDNEDKRADEYIARYGDRVRIFDKLAVSKTFDTADNFNERRTVVYARNYCFQLAKELGVEYFLELDDDYNGFYHRYADGDSLRAVKAKRIDNLFDMMLDFLEDSGALTVAFAQAGDFIGGLGGGKFTQGILRKAMNTFFCKTSNPFDFLGRINEDVNTYVKMGSEGKLFFTICDVAIVQGQTQSNAGGMTDVYVDNGTYLKSFYTVMYCPSSVVIRAMGSKHYRLHHNVNWDCAVPKILSENWKKAE